MQAKVNSISRVFDSEKGKSKSLPERGGVYTSSRVSTCF